MFILTSREDELLHFRKYKELNEYDMSMLLCMLEKYDDKRKCPRCGLINYVGYDNCVNCRCYIKNEKITPFSETCV